VEAAAAVVVIVTGRSFSSHLRGKYEKKTKVAGAEAAAAVAAVGLYTILPSLILYGV